MKKHGKIEVKGCIIAFLMNPRPLFIIIDDSSMNSHNELSVEFYRISFTSRFGASERTSVTIIRPSALDRKGLLTEMEPFVSKQT